MPRCVVILLGLYRACHASALHSFSRPKYLGNLNQPRRHRRSGGIHRYEPRDRGDNIRVCAHALCARAPSFDRSAMGSASPKACKRHDSWMARWRVRPERHA